MTNQLAGIEEYSRLIPVARDLYERTSAISYQLLLPLFLLSCLMGYSADLGISGSILMRLKRLVMAALLLASFPMVAEFVQIIGVEIAKSIDDMTGIDMILDAAAKRADTYSLDLTTLINMGSDFLLGLLTFLSFLILMIARYFLLAFQHFYWLLLIVLAPFLILTTLFESSAGIAKNLYKNLFQIAAWPVIWSILSAFLKTMPFANIYAVDGELLTIIVLNLIISIALLFSPFILSQLCEGATLSVGSTLRGGLMKVISTTNPKLMAMQGLNKAKSTYRVATQSLNSRLKK